MSSISDSPTTNVLALVGVLLAAALASLTVYLQYRQALKQSTIEAESRVAAAQLQPSAVDNLSSILVQNFRVLNTYYTENLSQARACIFRGYAGCH